MGVFQIGIIPFKPVNCCKPDFQSWSKLMQIKLVLPVLSQIDEKTMQYLLLPLG